MNFNFLGGLASLLPGYIQGQRMANQDNWQDLMNYNQVKEGQLGNLFNMATFQPRLDMYRNAWIDSYEQTLGNIMAGQVAQALHPGNMLKAEAETYWSPVTANINPSNQIRMWGMTYQDPTSLYQSVLGGRRGNTPSSQWVR